MNIYIAGDNHGYKVIEIVKEWLEEKGMEYKNLGVDSSDKNTKCPVGMPLQEMLPTVASNILEKDGSLGIVSCGTGIGTEVGINKFSGIRAVLATDPELAEWSRVKDNCNVLCLVGWRVDRDNIRKILDKWFSSEYDGSENRLRMIKEFDTWH